MKKTIPIIMTIIFFFGLPILTYAGQKDKRYKKNNRGGYERVYRDDHPMHHPHGRAYGHYKDHHNRKYRNYRYKGHHSWNEWRHHRHEYDRYHHRRYHHDDNGYLMFSCCEDQNRSVCYSISIDSGSYK